jgi:predicted transcriptional regulator
VTGDPRKKSSEVVARRNRFEIWAQLLELCLRAGKTQSWLLRKLGVNTNALKDALEFLETRELLTRVDLETLDTAGYITTPRGEEALLAYYTLVKNYFSKQQ